MDNRQALWAQAQAKLVKSDGTIMTAEERAQKYEAALKNCASIPDEIRRSVRIELQGGAKHE